MKKIILILSIVFISGFVNAQTTNYEMKFRYHNRDTLLSRITIHFWSESGQFPAYLKWENAPFSIRPSNISGVGLFTDSTSSFTSGQNVGWAFTKFSNTGSFMYDYIESNIGMYINDSQTPNVSVISTPQGLMMKAATNIAPNTEIIARYQDIINMFPNDESVKLLIQYW